MAGYVDENKDSEFLIARNGLCEAIGIEQDQRDKALEDIEFCQVEDCQWDPEEKDRRKNRPKPTVNKVALAVNQVIGDMRQSHVSVKVRPSKGGKLEIAEVYNGLIRDILNKSNFQYIQNIAGKEQIAGGIGAWQIVTEYDENSVDEQVIRIKPIHSAASSVYFDVASKDEHHMDAMRAWVTRDISTDLFKEKWPDETPSSVDRNESANISTDQDRDVVRIADYWYKKPYKRTIYKFSDGSVRELDDDLESVLDELGQQGITVIADRTYDSYKVCHRIMHGGGFLTEEEEWAGSKIPVIPVYGYEMWHNGSHYYRGMVRFAKDAQRVYNYTTAAKMEQTALANTNRWLVTKRQLTGNEKWWSTTDPWKPLVYNPDSMVPGGAPIKPTSSPVNSALIEQTQQAEQDIFSTIGRQAQSLISNPREQSGRALMQQAANADLGTYELRDAQARAVRYTGELLLELIPKIYDTERQERILKEDGSSEFIYINKEIVDAQTGRVVLLNDLNQGSYDVISDVGPSYQTKRAEAADQMAFLIQTAPDLAPLAMPFWLENLDSPGANELSKALRWQQVKNGMIEPNEEEQKRLQAAQQDPAVQMQQQMAQMMAQLQMKMAEAEARLKAAEAFTAEIEAQTNQAKFFLEVEQAKMDVEKTESDAVKNYAQAEKLKREAREPISRKTAEQ